LIEVVIFAPQKAAKTLVKARSEQEQPDEQNGVNDQNDEEFKDKGSKDDSAKTEFEKKGADLKAMRERLAALKSGNRSKTKNNEETKVEEEIEVEVKDEFVASGSRDKRIKIWNAKRGS
jgi:hypothetical protein